MKTSKIIRIDIAGYTGGNVTFHFNQRPSNEQICEAIRKIYMEGATGDYADKTEAYLINKAETGEFRMTEAELIEL